MGSLDQDVVDEVIWEEDHISRKLNILANELIGELKEK